MISVVSVYNNPGLLDRFLIRSLERQNVEYDLHLVDNTQNAFTSAAAALNHGAKDAKGDYILFAHQDVSLAHTDWLESVENTLSTLLSLGIAGSCGKVKKGNHTYSNAEHAPYPRPACANRLTVPMKVHTLDECIMIVPKAVFDKHKFNDEVCNGWHLYGVEYCLRMNRHGLHSYVIPQPIYHWAGTQTNPELQDSYYASLKRLLPHYPEHRHIATTCGDWSTLLPVSVQRLKFWRYVWKIRPFLKADRKVARLVAAAAATPHGRRLIRHFTLQSNTKVLYDISREKHYDQLRQQRNPKTRYDRDRLIASDINEHLALLEMLTREFSHKVVLELGTATGQSTLSFLHAVRDTGGHLVSMDVDSCTEAKAAVRESGLGSKWTFIQGDDMAQEWHSPIDHLFIDTSHAYDHTLAELHKYEPHVRPGGVITMHDIISFPGVQRAIDEYLKDKPNLRQYSMYNNHGLAVIFKGANG